MSNKQTSKKLMLRGLYPATVTPFTADGKVDMEALRRHFTMTVSVEGVQGIAINAGIGEVMQLDDEEKLEILGVARETMKKGQLLISGIDTHGRNAVKDALLAKRGGADALLVLPPFDVRAYRRLAVDPKVVHEFFSMLDREVGLPMIIFQYPSTSGCAYSIEALVRAASIPSVVGIKAACATVTDYVELWTALHDRLSILVARDSPSLLGMLLHGADGALIGISVVHTPTWVELIQCALSGDAANAQRIHRDFCIPIMDGVFENQKPKTITSEVARVKEALRQLGQIPLSNVRAPAVGVSESDKDHVRRSLLAAGLKIVAN